MSLPKLIGVIALVGALAVALYLWSRDPDESAPMTQPVATAPARVPAPAAQAESSHPEDTQAAHDPAADRTGPTVQWMLALADWLESRGDVESVTAAALMVSSAQASASRSGDPRPDLQQRTLALLQRMARFGPSDPEIHFVGLAICQNLRSPNVQCDPQPFAQALVAADPGNATVWMPALRTAVDGKDVITQMATLSRMAGAERFDMYTVPVSAMMSRILEAAPVAKPLGAGGLGVGEPGSIVPLVPHSPDLGALRAACSPPANSEVIASCNRITRTMRNANELITRIEGVKIELGLAAPGSPLAQESQEALRALRWQTMQLSQLPPGLWPTVEMIQRLGGEPQAVEEALRLAGVSLTPPEGWTPGR